MKKLYSLFVAVLFFYCNSVAQKTASKTTSNQQQATNSTNWVTMMQDGKSNFYDIQKAFNSAWQKKEANLLSKLSKKKLNSAVAKEEEEELPGGYMIFKRWENFWKPRVYPKGRFPNPAIAHEEFEKWKSAHSQPQNYN